MKTRILALSALLLSACFGHEADPRAKELTLSTGRQFAQALVAGRYAEAHSLLGRDLQRQYTPASLQARYASMISYGEGTWNADGYTLFEPDWPARQSHDLGWLYVSISTQGYSEAVTVIVTQEEGAARIRELEWGRP